MSPARRAKLTADRVTFADCVALYLEITVFCSSCQKWRGVHPENGVPAKLQQQSIIRLFIDEKFRCQPCGGRLADAITVTFPGNHIEERREVLRFHRSGGGALG